MIKCNFASCPEKNDNICCYECERKNSCDFSCVEEENNCKHKEIVEETRLQVFERKAATVIREIANLSAQKKALEAHDKMMREQLENVMDEYNVKSFENDIIKITYVEPTTRESIDGVKLRKELPEVAAKYTKVSNVKGSVRITVK